MKEQVADMPTVLERQTEEVSSMRKTIDEQHVMICNLTRNNEKLLKENRRLKIRLSKYEEPVKDSRNSSTPPSKEDIRSEAARRTRSLRRPSGLKPGGQPGHEGTTLKKTERPDETEDVFANYCTNCGHGLADCVRELDYVTQVISLPGLRPVTKEIRHFITTCRQCGTRVLSHNPRKRGTNGVVYDSSVKSFAVYLSVVHFLPYGRIEAMLNEMFGLGVSQGSLVNWVSEAKRNSEPAI